MAKSEGDSRSRRKAGSTGARAHSFGYRLDPEKGVVICQVAELVTKEGWREIEELIQFFRCFAPGMDSFHVELRR